MQKYTDLTKQPFSVHNANIMRKHSESSLQKHPYPSEMAQRRQPRISENNFHTGGKMPIPRSYSHSPWDYNYGPPLPTSFPAYEVAKKRNLKGTLLIIAIVITTSLYVYSEATHNENSVFYKMKEISLLFLSNKGFIAPPPTTETSNNTDTLSNNNEDGNQNNQQLAEGESVATKEKNGNEEVLSNVANIYKNAATQTNLIFSAFMPVSDVDGSITFLDTKIEINDNNGIEYGDALREMINMSPKTGDIWQNFFNKKVKIRKAWVENETLIIDFNRSFEYSRYGYHGLEARIQQILHTAFSFPLLLDSERIIPKQEIKYISLLIEGRRKNEIGGDGMALSPFYAKEDLINVITPKK